MRHVVIAAATSAMMHTLLRRWLQPGPLTLSLIGRDPEKLHILQQDLCYLGSAPRFWDCSFQWWLPPFPRRRRHRH